MRMQACAGGTLPAVHKAGLARPRLSLEGWLFEVMA
jgi:hypothetical protein